MGGIDANYTTASAGFTALTLAVLMGKPACVRALAAAGRVDVNQQSPQRGNRSALHMACSARSAEMAELLLLAGGRRALRDDHGSTPLDYAEGSKGVVAVFASGVDYWQRTRHTDHTRALKEAVAALLLARQRLDARAALPPAPPPALPPLPHLPEEIWLAACRFLCSADFVP